MALFLVQKKGSKKTLGVYHIFTNDIRAYGKDPAEAGLKFLLWDGSWVIDDPQDYEPMEFDNVFAEDSNDGQP